MRTGRMVISVSSIESQSQSHIPTKRRPRLLRRYCIFDRLTIWGRSALFGIYKRYHDIKTSCAGVYRILKRNAVSRLPRGTRLRKVHTKRYQKQVPGHQIQVDIKFLTFQGKDEKPIKRYQYTAIRAYKFPRATS